MSRAENKADRLLEMEALLLTHSQGLTQSEMARRLGVDRSVIHRNLRDFEKRFPTIHYDDGRIAIDRSTLSDCFTDCAATLRVNACPARFFVFKVLFFNTFPPDISLTGASARVPATNRNSSPSETSPIHLTRLPLSRSAPAFVSINI